MQLDDRTLRWLKGFAESVKSGKADFKSCIFWYEQKCDDHSPYAQCKHHDGWVEFSAKPHLVIALIEEIQKLRRVADYESESDKEA